jgi:integrase
MDITIYRRHAKDCTQQQDRYAPRCGCPLWAQYQFRGSQGKKSLKTRIWSEAQQLAGKLEQNLENLRLGKSASNDVTVGQAANEWLEFRSKNGLTNTKPKLMCGKLVAWCEANGILMLPAFTAQAAIKFRMSLPFRTGDSSSLAVHWSVIGGFFNWCAGMGYVEKNPIPSGRQNPQFAIRFDKKEVVPPTRKQVDKVLMMADGRVKVLAMLMRETGMALVDAQKFDPADLEDGTLIRGNRTKTRERYRVRISFPLKLQLEALGSPAFPGTYPKWREELYKTFRKAGVKMTPHGFRHFRISEWLAQGISVADVSKMVGTSEKEIRKTYEHWIAEAEERLDEVQRQSWAKMGLDENGNSKEAVQ